MRKITGFFALILMLSAFFVTVSAEGGDCGEGVTWAYENGTLTVSGSGAMEDYASAKDAPWYSRKGEITDVVFEDVTYVGKNAFRDYDGVRNITFGEGMRELGETSFYDCDSITTLRMPKSFKIFGAQCLRGCDNLAKVYCAGNFPSFRDSALWNGYVEVYFPTNNAWGQEYIDQVQSSYGGRLYIYPASMEKILGIEEEAETVPAEEEAPQETEAPETVATEPIPVETVATVPTEPIATEPVVTTVPPTTEAVPVPTAAPVVVVTEAPTTEETTAATTAPAAEAVTEAPVNPVEKLSPENLKIAIILVAAAFSVLIIGMIVIIITANSKRNRRRKNRYDR